MPRMRVIVAGDVTCHWHLARVPKLGVSGAPPRDATCISLSAGGPALLGELISAIGKDPSVARVGDIDVYRAHFPSESIAPGDERANHSYALWSRIDLSGKEASWRIQEDLGFQRATAHSSGADDSAAGNGKIDLIVLEDAGLGFRERAESWPTGLDAVGDSTPWVLLRMAGPVAEGALWDRLQDVAHRVIVVLSIDDLRLTEVSISRELSWERTAQDLMWELLYNPRIGSLGRCACVVVSFGTSGALLLPTSGGDSSRPPGTLIFDPRVMEEMWSEEHPGEVPERICCLTAGIARELLRAPEDPNIRFGIQRGISAMRALHLGGYDERETGPAPALAFPIERVTAELSSEDVPFSEVEVPDPSAPSMQPGDGGEHPRDWTILEDRFPGGLEELARRVVLEGTEHTLQGVPIGQFGKLLTVDRHEIEGLRSVRNLIREYSRQSRPERPVSIAVFGPPGSGKSFGVKEVARAVLPGKIAVLTFNLSQFDEPRELLNAFHQVRDASLAGQLPLVFWDEFDTGLGGESLGWLRHFLAPMQDGSFQEGQITHPIGPAVFVFAGGTSARMQEFAAQSGPEFRRAKGPDFVSRLKGYVNVLGPNPQGGTEEDPYHVLRRAVLLRVLLMAAAPQMFDRRDGKSVLQMDPGVLRAFLLTREYRHGARSMESVVAISSLTGKRKFERSCLPAEPQLDLHVDARDFLDLIQRLDLEGDILERLAEAAHIVFCAARLEEGFSWAGDDADYLRHHELLRPYAEREGESTKTHPALVPYEQLGDEEREQNRALVREIPNKLAAIGYAMRSARGRDHPARFTEDEIEALSEQEHERWLARKLTGGWSFGEIRDDAALRHPSLLPWHKLTDEERVHTYGSEWAARIGDGELPDDEKEKDRDLIRGIARVLAVAGYTVARVKTPEVPKMREVHTITRPKTF